MTVAGTVKIDGIPKIYLNDCANDLWIREVVFPGKKNGYFVEAGAADGMADSSCCILEKQMDWRGICIEPHDAFFERLPQNRPNSICENVCLANDNGWVEFAVSSGAHGSPYLSGVRDRIAAKWQGDRVLASASFVRKRSAALADLLKQHGAPKDIEYGAFDIEGSEFEALRSFPFGEYRFLALSFETDGSIAGPLARLLVTNGYKETTNRFNQDHPWERYWLHESMVDGHPLKGDRH